MFTAKEFFKGIKVKNIDCRFNLSQIPSKNSNDWLFNSCIEKIDVIDKLLIIGCDPRREASVLNSRIRQRWLTGALDILSLCTPDDLTYKSSSLGNDISILSDPNIQEKIKGFFKDSSFPMIILGDSILGTKQGKKIHKMTKILSQESNLIRKDWNGFNILNKFASRVGGLTVGFVPYDGGMSSLEIKEALKNKKLKVIFLIEADDFKINESDLENSFVIYIGHHGDRFAGKADVILPTSAFTEKKALYLNLEGRPQFTKAVISKPGLAVDSWKVFKALDQKLSSVIKFNNYEELLKAMFIEYPLLQNKKYFQKEKWIMEKNSNITLSSEVNNFLEENFYQTCSISRSSENMANCVRDILKLKKGK